MGKKLTEEYHSKFSDLLGALDLFELSTEDPIPLETWIGVAQALADASGYRFVLQTTVLESLADSPGTYRTVGYRGVASAKPSLFVKSDSL